MKPLHRYVLPMKVDYFFGIKLPKGKKLTNEAVVKKVFKLKTSFPKGTKIIVSVVTK